MQDEGFDASVPSTSANVPCEAEHAAPTKRAEDKTSEIPTSFPVGGTEGQAWPGFGLRVSMGLRRVPVVSWFSDRKSDALMLSAGCSCLNMFLHVFHRCHITTSPRSAVLDQALGAEEVSCAEAAVAFLHSWQFFMKQSHYWGGQKPSWRGSGCGM